MKNFGFLLVVILSVTGMACSGFSESGGKRGDNGPLEAAIQAAGHDDGTVTIGNHHTGAVRATLYEPLDPEFLELSALRWKPQAAISPKGRYIATVRGDEPVVLWDAASTQEIVALKKIGVVSSIRFSPTGCYLAVLGHQNKVSGTNVLAAWNISSPEELILFRNPEGVPFSTIRFSDDDAILAAWDSKDEVSFWDLETGKEIDRFKVNIKLNGEDR